MNTERKSLIARLRVGITHDTRDDIVTGSCYDLERAAEEAADMLAADAQDEWHRGRAAGIEECEKLNAGLKKLGAE